MTADAVGGVWRYALDLSAELRRRGVDVTIAVIGPEPSRSQRAAAAARRLALVCSTLKLEWMDDAGDDVEKSGRWLVTIARALRPDVVHLNGYAHAALPWSTPAIVVAHSCVCSWWRAVHGVEVPPQWAHYRRGVEAGLAAARTVVAPTRAMLDTLAREYDASCADLRVIPNGLPLRPQAVGRKAPVVLAAGRLWDEAKNIAALAAAAPSLAWPVYVAGAAEPPDGVPTDACQMSSQVRMLGVLEPAQLERWYARASIYALPARYEPFGLSVLEAARAGCALVLGDIASLRENWSGAAVFVPPDDRSALAAALRRLIARPDERLALAAAAHARAGQLTIERTADAYMRVYADALVDRGRRDASPPARAVGGVA